MHIQFTEKGLIKVNAYINAIRNKRKEILSADKDTIYGTKLLTIDDIKNDVLYFIDNNGLYSNNWKVTDEINSDFPLCLSIKEDFVLL